MGHNSSDVRGRKQKTEQENQIFGPVLTTSLEWSKNCIISDALLCVGSLVKVSNQFDYISGASRSSLNWYFLMIQKHLKYENSEIYKSDVN